MGLDEFDGDFGPDGDAEIEQEQATKTTIFINMDEEDPNEKNIDLNALF